MLSRYMSRYKRRQRAPDDSSAERKERRPAGESKLLSLAAYASR